MNVYFDNAAATVVRDEVIGAMGRVMREGYGNPSSTHRMGRRAADELGGARACVADAMGARPEEVCFTSGGTEADNWAVLKAAELAARFGKHVVTSAVEHDAVIEPMKKLESMGWDVTYLLPDSAGRISRENFASALRDDTALASIMLVNNETGAVNPIGEFSMEIKLRKLRTILHTDAVQGFCKIPFAARTLGADLISLSGHKIHAPKGVGALYVKSGVKLPPMLLGGGQENGKRSGTEALPLIVGFGEAARLGSMELCETAAAARSLREHIVALLASELPQAVVIGDGDSPFIVSLSLPGYKSEVLMNFLDGEGVYVAKSAACKKGARSRVLEAMRLKNDIIDGAIRVSLSRYSTREEAEYFVDTLKKAVRKIAFYN